jgi:methylenetetrahydrofolate dehydrogenase (NADP+) / methenyltetrahydrofolate cyclohydrolase
MVAALVLDGRSLARQLEAPLARRVATVTAAAGGRAPRLAIVLVGADGAAETYARMKESACRRIGIAALQLRFAADAATAEVVAAIDRLNDDDGVQGIFLQHPVAGRADQRRCFDRIALAKDVGGDTCLGLGWRAVGRADAFPSATPAAILRLLAHYGIDVAARQALVVGNNTILARPMAMMLLGADATVTLCDPAARDLRDLVHQAQILVGAAGIPHCVQGAWIGDGAVVVDAGYHPQPGGGTIGVGDIDLAGAADRCAAYTPVPGGVGPVTIATLLTHTVEAAERAARPVA